jgi:hypothetical protein
MRRLRTFIIVGLIFLMHNASLAQCAMCRTQVVNNVSAGDTSLAAGLNFGILYLFFTPYVLIGVVIFLWFKYSRRNVKKRSLASRLGG